MDASLSPSQRKLYLFGRIELSGGDQEQTERLVVQPKLVALLAYLALHEAPQDRRTLAAALWPDSDPDEARANLRRHLHYLKQALPEAEGTPWLRTDGSHVRLEPAAPVWIDVRAFEDAVRAGELEAAVALYADPSYAKRVLGWEAKHKDPETIIRSAWNWFSRHPKGYGD